MASPGAYTSKRGLRVYIWRKKEGMTESGDEEQEEVWLEKPSWLEKELQKKGNLCILLVKNHISCTKEAIKWNQEETESMWGSSIN